MRAAGNLLIRTFLWAVTVGIGVDGAKNTTSTNETTTSGESSNTSESATDGNAATTSTNGTATGSNNTNSGVVYDGCDIDVYYAGLSGDPSTWTLEDVRQLLTETHRNILPVYPAQEDMQSITEAMISLYPGSTKNSVHLVYSDSDMASRPANGLENWRTERLWPVNRGAIVGNAINTDVHTSAPAKWTVLDDKLKINVNYTIFFGMCGTVDEQANCITPASVETASDTAHDTKVYTPEEAARGWIARSLFYDVVRYNFLTLVDCPPFFAGQYGYKSALLEWSSQYPVTDAEKERNDKACSLWQGNRNPFVDYPQLVETLIGTADTIAPNSIHYSACAAPTEGPTATPNDCSSMRASDVFVFGFNSMDPDQILFYPIYPVSAGVGRLYVTNNAWSGSAFLPTGGTIEYIVPDDGVHAGTMFGYQVAQPGLVGNFTKQEGSTFSLNQDGDVILLYCLNADDEPHFINAVSFGGKGWAPANGTSYAPGTSSLPASLDPYGSVALGDFSNWFYNGTQELKASVLIPAFSNATNWLGSDSPFDLPTPSGAWTLSVFAGLALASVMALFM